MNKTKCVVCESDVVGEPYGPLRVPLCKKCWLDSDQYIDSVIEARVEIENYVPLANQAAKVRFWINGSEVEKTVFQPTIIGGQS